VILMFEKMLKIPDVFFVGQTVAMGGRIVCATRHRRDVAGPSRIRGAFDDVDPTFERGWRCCGRGVRGRASAPINNDDSERNAAERLDERLNTLGAASHACRAANRPDRSVTRSPFDPNGSASLIDDIP